ncbi:hypothetical protein ALQ01_200083 [Pseudomonas savastanoi pv. glycinea]|nr:hypothetical protein ALQ01_200083 [Pseudomonas savastanoi pv. glycinea]
MNAKRQTWRLAFIDDRKGSALCDLGVDQIWPLTDKDDA